MKKIISIIMLVVLPLAGCASKPDYNWNVCEYKNGELVVREASSSESKKYEEMHNSK